MWNNIQSHNVKESETQVLDLSLNPNLTLYLDQHKELNIANTAKTFL